MAAFGESTPGTVNVRVRTPGGVMSFDLTDFGPYPLWSTATVAAPQSTELVYFQYGRGSPKPGAGGATGTKLDTNLDNNAGQLGAADEMLVWSMRIQLPNNITLNDIRELMAKTYNAMYISIQKPVSEGPIEFYPAAGGIFGTTTQNASENWTNGVPQSTAGRSFASPHYIGHITSFRVSQEFIQPLAMAAARDVRVVLDGLRRRAMG